MKVFYMIALFTVVSALSVPSAASNSGRQLLQGECEQLTCTQRSL
jgi:hypothetical protein